MYINDWITFALSVSYTERTQRLDCGKLVSIALQSLEIESVPNRRLIKGVLDFAIAKIGNHKYLSAFVSYFDSTIWRPAVISTGTNPEQTSRFSDFG